MKVLAIYGATFDTFGGTRFVAENTKALRYVGHQVDLVVGNDMKPDKIINSSATGIILSGKFTDRDYIDKIIKTSEDYDLTIIYCLPFIEKNDTSDRRDLILDNVIRLLDGIKTKLIVSNVDQNNKVFKTKIGLEQACRRADLVLHYAKEGTLAKKLKEWKIDTPMDHQYTSRDFSYLRDKYWRPVSDMNLRSATWIGRSTSWKKPELFADFAYDKLRHNGFVSTIEGIERSIVYFRLLKYQRPDDFLDYSRYVSGDHTDLKTDRTYIFNKYVYEEEMERLSHTGFGADLYTLKYPEYYGTSLEQAHIDVVNVGSILMCSKHYGEHSLTMNGNSYIEECPEIIYLDRDNFDECLDRMIELSSDPVLFDRTRNRIYDFIRSQSDISVVGPKLDEIIHRVVD